MLIRCYIGNGVYEDSCLGMYDAACYDPLNDNRRIYEASQDVAWWFEETFQSSRELHASEEYAYSFADAWWD